jgi:hypothetical protein
MDNVYSTRENNATTRNEDICLSQSFSSTLHQCLCLARLITFFTPYSFMHPNGSQTPDDRFSGWSERTLECSTCGHYGEWVVDQATSSAKKRHDGKGGGKIFNSPRTSPMKRR